MPSFLNFQHLYYFWIVAREGGISRASDFLDLSASTISAQVGQLEDALGVKLFHRVGRNIRLTDVGHVAFRYCEEIFVLGRELTHALEGWHTRGPVLLQVGVADAVPKLVATRLLGRAISKQDDLRLICREDDPDRLLAELALHHFDVVLLDAPVDSTSRIQAFNHLLAEWPVAFFGVPELVRRYRDDFPASLEGAPVLLPTGEASARKQLDRFFEEQAIQPRITGEFDDTALMKAFSENGSGLFPAPSALAPELERQHGVEMLGALEDCVARFYAVTVERQIEHPAVAAICGAQEGGD